MGFKKIIASLMLPLLRTSGVVFLSKNCPRQQGLGQYSLQTQEGIQMAGGCHRALISQGNAGHSTRIINIPCL
jgi:hypothetical protein